MEETIQIDAGEPVHEVVMLLNRALASRGLKFEDVSERGCSWYEFRLVQLNTKE
jgi:hypothetical protein